MESLLELQKAHYAPHRGPPMLLYKDHNPQRRRKRKRRKLSKKHVPLPHRSKDSHYLFPASQLPEGFPSELSFRALAVYAFLRTLSCELRLSPFTPNAFLRALYLPYPNKLLGQIHASLLRILLASLNMGYHCKPRGNNIPDVIRKKRRVDGIRWSLRAGDNLTFLDNFSWPLFYDDYVHLTADIIWATLNDDENHTDFRNIGDPDLTGMMLEDEDLIYQEEEESLMAKPAKISNLLGLSEKYPFVLGSLSRSSRSGRREKVSYGALDSDIDSYEEEPIDDDANNDDDEDYMAPRRSTSSSKKRSRTRKNTLPKSSPTKSSTRKLPTNASKYAYAMNSAGSKARPIGHSTGTSLPLHNTVKEVYTGSACFGSPAIWAAISNGTWQMGVSQLNSNVNHMPFSTPRSGPGLPGLISGLQNQKTPNPPYNHSPFASKKSNSSRSPTGTRKSSLPLHNAPTSKRTPAVRKLPMHDKHDSTPPPKKVKRSSNSGSKVEWVEEAEDPIQRSHMSGSKVEWVDSPNFNGNLISSGAHVRTLSVQRSFSFGKHVVTSPDGNISANFPQGAGAVCNGGQALMALSSTLGTTNPNFFLATGNNHNFQMPQQVNEAFARAQALSQAGPMAAIFSPSVPLQGFNARTLVSNPRWASNDTRRIGIPASPGDKSTTESRCGVSKNVSNVLHNFIAGKLFKSDTPAVTKKYTTGQDTGLSNGKSAMNEKKTSLVDCVESPTNVVSGKVRFCSNPESVTTMHSETPLTVKSEPRTRKEPDTQPQSSPANAPRLSEEPIVDPPQSAVPTDMPRNKEKTCANDDIAKRDDGDTKSDLSPEVVHQSGKSPEKHLYTCRSSGAVDPEENMPAGPPLKTSNNASADTNGEHSHSMGTDEAKNVATLKIDEGQHVDGESLLAAKPQESSTYMSYEYAKSSVLRLSDKSPVGGKVGGTIMTACELAPSEKVKCLKPEASLVIPELSASVRDATASNGSNVKETTITERNECIPREGTLESATCDKLLEATDENNLSPPDKHINGNSLSAKVGASETMSLPKVEENEGLSKPAKATHPCPSLAPSSSAAQSPIRLPEKAMKEESTDDGSSNSELLDACWSFADDEEQWPQFQPLHSLRSGIPYHRLPLEEKLTILEFLIDELLTLGTFTAVFSRRHDIMSFHSTLYGSLPSQSELDNLENGDECAVCGGEGELLCCDGCTSSWHRACIDMKPYTELPEGRWLCPECELVDPANYGSLQGGKKCSLDWFTADDVKTAIRIGKERNFQRERNILSNNMNHAVSATQPTLWGDQGLLNGTISHGPKLTENESNEVIAAPSTTWCAPNLSLDGTDAGQRPSSVNVASLEGTKPSYCASGADKNDPTRVAQLYNGMESIMKTQNLADQAESALSSSCQPDTFARALVEETFASQTSKASSTTDARFSTELEGSKINGDLCFTENEFLVVHGFVFRRPRRPDQRNALPPPHNNPDCFELLGEETLSKVLKSLGPDLALAWPVAQVPFTAFEVGGQVVKRSTIHPKVITFETKATFDPSHYTNKYRKTPLSKLIFPGAGFQSYHLLNSDYEHTCTVCNVKRLTDRLSPDVSGDKSLVQSLRAEASLFDPYQPIRDYMLKVENLLNRANLLNEFWGTRNKDLKINVWQTNVSRSRSIPRLALLLLKLVDSADRRVFTEQWFVIAGSKDTDQTVEITQRTDSRPFLPLSSDWTPKAENRKRKWERSTLANVRSLLAQENSDVESFVYGREGVLLCDDSFNKRKRKQTFSGRSAASPMKLSNDFDEIGKGCQKDAQRSPLPEHALLGLEETSTKKSKVGENETVAVSSVKGLQEAIDRRVTSGILAPEEGDASEGENNGSKKSSKSRRSRRSGRLQTKKESPEDFLANVIADSGKSHKDLSMETIIEAQKMAKLIEIKELGTIPFVSTGHWPAAGRLLFEPIGEISGAELRRLGRNAGTVRAQEVSYTGLYEVGEVTHFHVWRKNLRRCASFEELLLLIRALESNLDKHTISSCESLAKRSPSSRAQILKVVRCSQKDLSTGTIHHFVFQKSKNRACWFSSLSTELSVFMAERSERREKRLDAFNNRLTAKTAAEVRAREEARAKEATAALARAQKLAQEQAAERIRVAREQAEERKKKQEAIAAAKAKKEADKIAAKKQKEEAKAAAKRLKEEQKAKKKAEAAAKIAARKSAEKAAVERSLPSTPQTAIAAGGGEIQQEVLRVLSAHKFATQQLIQKSSKAGLTFVPEAEMKNLRTHSVSRLQACYRGGQVEAGHLFAQLGNAEQEALVAERAAKRHSVSRQCSQQTEQRPPPSQQSERIANYSAQAPRYDRSVNHSQQQGVPREYLPEQRPPPRLMQQAQVHQSSSGAFNLSAHQTSSRFPSPGSHVGGGYASTSERQYASHSSEYGSSVVQAHLAHRNNFDSSNFEAASSFMNQNASNDQVNSHRPQQSDNAGSGLSSNQRLLQSQLLRVLQGDGKQQSLEGLSDQMRAVQQAGITQGSQIGTPGNPAVSNARDMAHSHQFAQAQYHQTYDRNGYVARSTMNYLQTPSNNYSSEHQNNSTHVSADPGAFGYSNPAVYGATGAGYPQNLPTTGSEQQRMHAEASPNFDIEPTPIEEMRHAPYNINAAQRYPHSQQYQYHHQWYQR